MVDYRLVTKRFVLQVGFTCPLRCRFCYYKESLASGKVKDFTTKQIKKMLLEAKRLGKTEVELSGGEPTIRADIFDILSYAKSIGYKTICIITNGLMTHNIEFMRKLVKAGLNEFLFSIHSPIESEHDWLTRVKGSWKKIIKSVENAEKLVVNYRTNTVIMTKNCKNTDSLFELLKKYNPLAVNLLVYNPSNSKECVGPELVDYNLIGDELKKSIKKSSLFLWLIRSA